MLTHNLATALRHFRKAKLVTTINVLCLTFGLSCFMLSYGLVQVMEKPDAYHEKASRTYVVTQRSELTDAVTLTMPMTGRAYGPLLKSDYPELESVVRASRGAEIAVSADLVKGFAMAAYVDPEYLDVFDFDFVAGDHRRALQTPRSAVINDELALQLFGRTDVIGTALVLNNRETVRITGVMKAPRQPSHMSNNPNSVAMQPFQLLVSIDAWNALRPEVVGSESGRRAAYFGFDTYIFLVFKENSAFTPEQLRADLPGFTKRHRPEEFGDATLGIVPGYELGTVAMDFASRREQTGLTIPGITSAMGVLALIVACLNYANLASAQATTHLKEIAMRRVVGATYRQVVAQAFLEALLLVMAAALLALALMPPLSSMLYATMGMNLYDLFSRSLGFWTTLLAAVVGVAALASLYPALVTARIHPAQSLHSGRTPVFKMRVMRVLVICQFAAASFLFVSARILDSYNDRMLLAVSTEGDDPVVVITNDLKEIGVDRQSLQNRLRESPGITGVSAIEMPPGQLFGPSTIVSDSADPESRRTMVIGLLVDFAFFESLKIPLLTGRDFDRGMASDTSRDDAYGNVIVDRAFALERGWSPQQAIGKAVFTPSGPGSVGRPSTIIGVVENRTLYPAKLGSAATLYALDQERLRTLLVRISKNDVSRGVQSIDTVWNEFAPRVALKRKFFDEAFEASYRRMSGMARVSGFLSGFALVIAATGLIGIATHAIGQRTHEIGVRRSLGASASRVVIMLLKDFSKPILIGNLIAWPLAFAYGKVFESMYVDQPPPSIWPYLASLALGLLVAWLAVFHKAWSAARRSPAAVLRHE
jgi:putative ABC transport system permease protein